MAGVVVSVWVGLVWIGFGRVADKPAHAAARCLYMKGLRSVRGQPKPKGGDDVSLCWVGLVDWFGLGWFGLVWVELVWTGLGWRKSQRTRRRGAFA